MFDEAGLADDLPVGDQPDAGRATAGRPSTGSSATTPRRARPPRSTSRTRSRPTKVFVIDDASEYGKGLADIVARTSARRSSATTRSSRSRPTSPPSVTKVKASGADAVFFGGYYAEAGLLVKQLRDAGWKGTVRRRLTASRTTASSRPPAPAAEGAILTCPCLPPDTGPGRSQPTYKAAYNADPGTYSAEALRRRERLPRRHRGRQVDRADMLDFVEGLRQARASPSRSSSTPRASRPTSTVCAYKVDGRQDRPGSARSSSTGRHRQGRSERCGRDRPPIGSTAPATAPLHPAAGGLGLQFLFDNFFAADHHRAWRSAPIYAPRRARLHAGLRRAAADQLRPLRGLHVRHLRRALGRHAARRHGPARQRRRGRLLASLAMLRRGDGRCPAAIALLLERVAYRPLRKRNAPPLDLPDLRHRRVVRARRDHGSARQDRRLVRPRRRPARLRRPRARQRRPARHRRRRRPCSPSATTRSPTSTSSSSSARS